jgi:hypothetical protein
MQINYMRNYKEKQNNTTLIHDCFSCVTAACNTAFRISKGRKLKTRRTVPWWNDELKISWKKVNALRRRYQQTLNNEDTRENSYTMRENDNTNRNCGKKNLNHGRSTAPQWKI